MHGVPELAFFDLSITNSSVERIQLQSLELKSIIGRRIISDFPEKVPLRYTCVKQAREIWSGQH